nr:DEAD/DEAH box helicase [Bacillus sp. FJAT-27986]
MNVKASRHSTGSSPISLQQLLIGKELLITEIPNELKEQLDLNEQIYSVRGIENGICRRCGNTDSRLFATFPHSACGENCLYCRHCIMMGRISSCSTLFGWKGEMPRWSPELARLRWDGSLSLSQKEASEKIMEAVRNQMDLLIWAVCGAGKTEMIFAGIEEALFSGKRVCLATPRTDVILELAPRLRSVFPDIPIVALYGDSQEKQLFAPFVLSTTHQLMRYADAFEVMIIDEVDAFPYSFDPHLQYAVQKACKKDAAVIYLTATPSKQWQLEFQQGIRNGILLPARFHRHPIPVPTMKWVGNWQSSIQKNKLPNPLLYWLKTAIECKNPFLIFFPNIALMEKALPLFQGYAPEILSVHAEDSERKDKIMKLRRGEIQGLLTTTILERGVTIPKLNVAVIGAEDEIFTESALVQIAGRIGRSKDHPRGDCVYFHYGKTNAMLDAIQQINQMNREAVKRGLLD